MIIGPILFPDKQAAMQQMIHWLSLNKRPEQIEKSETGFTDTQWIQWGDERRGEERTFGDRQSIMRGKKEACVCRSKS